MSFLFSWLSRPYYLNTSPIYKLVSSFLFGGFVFLFLFSFRPFNIAHLYADDFLNYTLALGIITTISLLIFLFVFPYIFKKFFNPDLWVIGKSVLFTVGAVLFISYSNWHYTSLIQNKSDVVGLFSFLFYTASVGVIPITIFFLIDEKISRRKYQKKIKELKQSKQLLIKKTSISNTIVLKSENNNEKFTIDINKLVYISSEGNYISVFIEKEGQLKELVLRTTLSKIINVLGKYSTVVRCHKSYIVNSIFIEDILGNARGYLLKSSIIPFGIPVSRNFPNDELRALIG